MKNITPFQFFRYLIPGGITILYFIILVQIDLGSPIHEWAVFRVKFGESMMNINGLGAGILAILFFSLWGYFLNILYQSISRISFLKKWMRMDHRAFFVSVENKLVEFKSWKTDDPLKHYEIVKASELSDDGAWAIFDSEYYRRSTEVYPDKKPDELLRHEGLFDYWHSAGIILIGYVISFIIWCWNSPLKRTEIISFILIALSSLIIFAIMIYNYKNLKIICSCHVEAAFVSLLKRSYTPSIIYVGIQHLAKKK